MVQPAPVRKSWADIESDDDEPVVQLRVRASWADLSDEETQSSASVCEAARAPTPPRVRPRSKSGEECADRRVRVTWAQPLIWPSEASAAFAPATPCATETVSALAETAMAAQDAADDGWTTVPTKERKPAQRGTAARALPARQPQLKPRARPAASREEVRKIYVEMEDGAFPVARRLIGAGGGNLRRINEACRATVQLRGRGSGAKGGGGAEDLHLLVTAAPDRIPEACRQVHALVEQVREQYDSAATRAR